MDDTVPLSALYALVPAAEEEDLLEELAVERRAAEYAALVGAWMCWPSTTRPVWDLWSGEPTDPPVQDEPPEEPDPYLPPLPQVLGLLETTLGARVVIVDD